MSLFEDFVVLIFCGSCLGFGLRYGAWIFDGLLEIFRDFRNWLLSRFRKEP